MARTINEIFSDIGNQFAANKAVNVLYGLDENKPFSEQFSPVSLESIIFYRVAVAIWTLETVFDLFKQEVENILSTQKPHRLKWYRDKTLAFQKDYLLPVDSDVYEVTDEASQVVKYAAAVETSDSSKLLIKIAGGDELRDKLTDDVAEQVRNYLQWIKDAGVRIELVNQSPDYFRVEIDVYFNAMLLANRVRESVYQAIISYIENLPFNGEYSNMALIDALQGVEGVVIPELRASYCKSAVGGLDYELINTKIIPVAGYLRAYEATDITINMIAYELAQY